MKKILNKNNVYKIIIFVTLLSLACIFSIHKINNALFALSENPYYTNLYNINNKNISIRLTNDWIRDNIEDSISLSNNKTSENLNIITIEEGKYNVENFETIKTFFKLEFNDSYNSKNIDLDVKEINYKNNNEIYALSFIMNGKYNIVGIEKVNDELINFYYSVSLNSENTSELTKILDSIRINNTEHKGVENNLENK